MFFLSGLYTYSSEKGAFLIPCLLIQQEIGSIAESIWSSLIDDGDQNNP